MCCGSQPGWYTGLSSLEHIMGDRVSANHARDEDRPGQGEGEFAKQRACETTLESDWGIHGRQGNGHGNDRAHQLARADEGRLQPRPTLAHVTLAVFHHDDRVVHHQTDRKNNGQQG